MSARPLNLLDRVEVESRVGWILADPDLSVADEVVGRHGKVVRRRHVLEHAAREVVARAVARAEIAALPGRAHRAGLRLEFRETTEMRADADQHEILR